MPARDRVADVPSDLLTLDYICWEAAPGDWRAIIWTDPADQASRIEITATTHEAILEKCRRLAEVH